MSKQAKNVVLQTNVTIDIAQRLERLAERLGDQPRAALVRGLLLRGLEAFEVTNP